ncbi:UNVERIFIED_CONTAM: hypothetical protein GTU68_065584, partial [Idotea baltica]|nr:hypothetical protein [Idotea baltica]
MNAPLKHPTAPQILDYRGSDWKCSKSIEALPPELSVWSFKKVGVESELTLDLGLHVKKVKGVYHLSLYCPFWMVNKTGYDLTYKTDSLVHSIEHKKNSSDVVLFSFRSKSFFGKKKANIRVQDSDWSEKFPLDTVATAAAVTCKSIQNKDLLYQVSIDIQLSGSGLTKIVTFSPFYKVINRCSYDLQYCLEDDNTGIWDEITAGECVSVWPPGATKALKVRVSGTKERTEPIHFDAPHTTLFKLRNKFGGVFVEVSQTEGGTLISVDKCLEGASSALVLNHLKTSSLALWQEGHEDKKTELGPQQMAHFTWDSAESRRLLMFSCFGGSP